MSILQGRQDITFSFLAPVMREKIEMQKENGKRK